MASAGPSSAKARLKTSFVKDGSLEPFYSGGAVAATSDGEFLVTTFGTEVMVVEARTAQIVHRLEGVRVLVAVDADRRMRKMCRVSP